MDKSMLLASLLDEMSEVAPLDDHNRALVVHVHPTDWQNPQSRARYNLVVIGGGTAGLVTAAGAAGLGATVALVERKLLECARVGSAIARAVRAVCA
jgi:threonine dehydrogenase-like Zn-dependent dehydrogenase